MKKLIILAVLLTSLNFSCNKENNANSIGNDKPFEVAYGEAKAYSWNGFCIYLDSVLNDSRCPVDAVCIWAGHAQVRFVFKNMDKKTSFVLSTDSAFRNDTLLWGYRIKLVHLYPDRMVGDSITQKDYKAELKVTPEH